MYIGRAGSIGRIKTGVLVISPFEHKTLAGGKGGKIGRPMSILPSLIGLGPEQGVISLLIGWSK